MIISRACDVCQTSYNADTRYLNRGQGKTCSRICGYRLAQSLKPKLEPNTSCAWCQAPIYRKASALKKTDTFFCSKLHMDLSVSEGLLKTGPVRTKPRPNTRYSFEDKVSVWLSGDNDITLSFSRATGKPTDTKRFVKQYLVETRGDQCELCGFVGVNPHTNNSIIQMDHIDGDCFNNAPENLQLLCPNCHAMTPNYGALNKGSGRAHRRKATI